MTGSALANFDVAAFLDQFWQKRPLLFRQPWTEWSNPLNPDELAALAGEDHVESRLVRHAGDGWQQVDGPIAADRIAALGPDRWSLLVQAVDQHVPEVAELIAPFRFVPNWRIDDVMVSCASDGGGVGPHFDQYDVFLIQGLGRRRWQVGGRCDDSSRLIEHDDLRLLADFEPTDEWVLEPGDMLYIPPGLAHNGIAIGDDCMTYSIGFRAPSRRELITGFADHIAARCGDAERYADPDLIAQDNPGEIAPSALDRLHAMVLDAVLDRDAFVRWFGEHATTPRYPDMDWSPEEPVDEFEVRALLQAGTLLYRNPASRFSFVERGNAVLLFVDGECRECSGEAATFARRMCAGEWVEYEPGEAQADATTRLIAELVNSGSIAFVAE